MQLEMHMHVSFIDTCVHFAALPLSPVQFVHCLIVKSCKRPESISSSLLIGSFKDRNNICVYIESNITLALEEIRNYNSQTPVSNVLSVFLHCYFWLLFAPLIHPFPSPNPTAFSFSSSQRSLRFFPPLQPALFLEAKLCFTLTMLLFLRLDKCSHQAGFGY